MAPVNPNGSNFPRISSETKLEDIGNVLRSNGFGLNIEFGLGGYEVTITNIKNNIDYSEFSHDLLEALKKSLEKAFASKKDARFTKDELTIPATPKSKLSIKDISKLLSSGAEKKIKF